MPRIRTIKPESLQHRKVGRLSDRALRLWLGLLTQADDYGRGVGDPGQLRLLAFGYHPDVTEADVLDAIEEIAKWGLVRFYEVDSTPYYVFESWADHQKISHPAKSKLPPPPPLQSPPEFSGVLPSPPEPSSTIGSDLDRKDQGSAGGECEGRTSVSVGSNDELQRRSNGEPEAVGQKLDETLDRIKSKYVDAAAPRRRGDRE